MSTNPHRRPARSPPTRPVPARPRPRPQLRQDGGTYRASPPRPGPGTVQTWHRPPPSHPGTATAVLAVTSEPCPAPAWTPAAPGCGCGPCT